MATTRLEGLFNTHFWKISKVAKLNWFYTIWSFYRLCLKNVHIQNTYITKHIRKNTTKFSATKLVGSKFNAAHSPIINSFWNDVFVFFNIFQRSLLPDMSCMITPQKDSLSNNFTPLIIFYIWNDSKECPLAPELKGSRVVNRVGIEGGA